MASLSAPACFGPCISPSIGAFAFNDRGALEALEASGVGRPGFGVLGVGLQAAKRFQLRLTLATRVTINR